MRKKTIVVGITGSIAAYKTLDLIKALKNSTTDIQVITTENSQKLITIDDFSQASGNPVRNSLFLENLDYHAYLKNNTAIEHISLSDTADILVICPATANVLAKVSCGIADDLLTSTILATQSPVVFCPAMNVKMWQNPATQENIEILKKRGYSIIDPEYGELACGYTGVGRLANISKIAEFVDSIIQARNQLKGKKIVVTAGATSEPIDGVRFITNKSSGKMGITLADQAGFLGAEVILIRGSTTVVPKRHYKDIQIKTVDELFNAIEHEIKTADIVIHAAAVSDFGLKNPIRKKIKSNKSLSLELTPKTKILEKLKVLNSKCFVVGFKAEINVSKKKLLESADSLLKKSKADIIIANDVGKPDRGFEVDTNEVFIVDSQKKPTHLPLASKQEIAQKILEYIIFKLNEKN